MNDLSPGFHVMPRAVILLGLMAALALAEVGRGQASPAAPRVVVSLTFDDGYVDHVGAARLLTDHGLRGTFFVPSGFIGSAGYMTVADLQSLARDGHEIGGHTVTHPPLPQVSRGEAMRQVCNDRANLAGWGFAPTSFAYPYAATGPVAEDVTRACGYNSARGLDGVRTRFGCPECRSAETLPPVNAFHTAAPADVHNTWTLQDLKDTVSNALPEGGWVQETFHRVGPDASDDLNVSPEIFSEFIAWLAQAQAARLISVRTVHEVIGGTSQPLVSASPAPAPAPGANMLPNPGLEEQTADGPRCWQSDSYGMNTSTLTTTAPGRTGAAAGRLTVSNFRSGDAKALTRMDLGECSPAAEAGHAYSLKAWYKSTGPSHLTVFYRTGVGFWEFWCQSPEFPSSSEYSHAEWTTPVLPEGATAVSFGLSLSANGVITSDDYAMYDSGVSPAPGPAAVIPAPGPATTASAAGVDHLYDGMGWLAAIAVLGIAARTYYAAARLGTHHRALHVRKRDDGKTGST